MFGLLKACSCSKSRSERELRRFAYCGTCKSLGTLFGQKSRFFLNHDVVFLAELLLSLRKADDANIRFPTRVSAYKSFNCMIMPSVAQIPLELEIAASVNAVLAQFKLIDRQADAPGLQWRIASRIFAGEFASAARILEKLEFPLADAFEWLALQTERERACPSLRRDSLIESGSLDSELVLLMAEPTAEITGLFFENAVRACGHDESVAASFAKLGKSFGLLVYVLDALEDWKKDYRSEEFNALRACSEASAAASGSRSDEVLREPVRVLATSLIRDALSNIRTELLVLPLRPGAADEFAERFRSNTETRLRKFKGSASCSSNPKSRGASVSVCSAKSVSRLKCGADAEGGSSSRPFGSRQSWSDYIVARSQTARHFVARVLAVDESTTDWKAPLFALANWYCFLLAFLFPRPAEAAASLRDCLELPFNLIFITGAASSIVADVTFPLRSFAVLGAGGPLPPAGPSPGGPIPGLGSVENIERRRQKAEDHGCCDGCDCCSDCLDCGCCSGCDGCGDACACGHCAGADCSACDCGGCCHGCDCGGCDCAGCDCGGCDCNCS
ncbi:MAG: hypothetical protein K2W95_07940 [Candidatus Obscuribacterales bacterium]|nr:hypothetical protein [Candidatus Obscuribacterales bacterium]